MAADTNPHTAPTAPAPASRVRRPVLSRPPANPRSHEDIVADVKKRHAKTLAYLAAR
jgi:hypothetical protein